MLVVHLCLMSIVPYRVLKQRCAVVRVPSSTFISSDLYVPSREDRVKCMNNLIAALPGSIWTSDMAQKVATESKMKL